MNCRGCRQRFLSLPDLSRKIEGDSVRRVKEGDMLHINPVCLVSSSLEELTTYPLDEISGDIILVSRDMTFGEMTNWKK